MECQEEAKPLRKCEDLKTHTKICYWLGLSPYAWNPTTGYLELTKNKWKLLQCRMNIILAISYVAFLIVRFIQISIKPDGVTTKAQMQTFLSIAFLMLAFFLEFSKTWDRAHFLLNRTIHLSNKWQGGFQGEENNPVDEFMRQLAKLIARRRIIGLTTIPMIVMLYTIRMNFLPDRANHLTSLFRNPKSLTFLEKFPFLAIHCYIWALINYSILYAFAVLAFFGRTMKEHLCVLLNERKTENLKMQAFLKIYPQLQVLQLEFNDLWGNFLCCFLVLFVTSEILNLYQAVVLHTFRAIFIAAVMTYGLHILVSTASEHYSMSVDLLKSCKIQNISPWLQKYMRHCRPLFTTNGGFGFFDKPLLLTLWTVVIHNTVTLMVGHQYDKSKISM